MRWPSTRSKACTLVAWPQTLQRARVSGWASAINEDDSGGEHKLDDGALATIIGADERQELAFRQAAIHVRHNEPRMDRRIASVRM